MSRKISMNDIENIHKELDDEILFCTFKKFKMFLANDKVGLDALVLFMHLQFTERMQKTNRVKAKNSYLRKGLHWSEKKLKTAKKFLSEKKLIEYIAKKNASGKFVEHYIKVSATRTPEGMKTTPVENQPSGSIIQMLKQETKCIEHESKSLNQEKNVIINSEKTVAAPPSIQNKSFRESEEAKPQNNCNDNFALMQSSSEKFLSPEQYLKNVYSYIDNLRPCLGTEIKKMMSVRYAGDVKSLANLIQNIDNKYGLESFAVISNRVINSTNESKLYDNYFFSVLEKQGRLRIENENDSLKDWIKKQGFSWWGEYTLNNIYRIFNIKLKMSEKDIVKELKRMVNSAKKQGAKDYSGRCIEETIIKIEKLKKVDLKGMRAIFNSVVEKVVQEIVNKEKKEEETYKPEPYERIGDRYDPKKWEVYNWWYECKCGMKNIDMNEHDFCPQCKVKFSWRGILEKVEKAVENLKIKTGEV